MGINNIVKLITSTILTMSLLSTTALAINPTTSETPVKYTGIGTQTWELDVPAQLKPGQTGEVKLTGTWSSSKRIDINVDEQVELVNNIDGVSKELKVEFNNISEIGNNTLPIEIKEIIAVEEITDALFGEWTGNIVYNLSCKEYDTISVDKSNYEITGSKALEININNPTDGEVAIENSNTSVANAEIQNEKLIVTPKKLGTTKIKLKTAATNNYYESSVEFTIKVNKSDNELSIGQSYYTISNEDTLEIDVTNKSNGKLTIQNSDTSMATVSTSNGKIVITPKAEGVITVKIKSAATDLYNSSEIEFKVNISHNYTNGVCERCGEKDVSQLPAGLYDSNWNLKTSWNTLINNKIVYNKNGVITTNPVYYNNGNPPTNNSSSYLNGILIIPEGVKELGVNSLLSCDYLTGLVIPNSLKVIGENSFYSLDSKLSTVIVKNKNTNFKTVNGVLYNSDMTTLMQYPANKTAASFSIPNSVKVIGSSAFISNKYLTQVNIPYGVTDIGSNAFAEVRNLTRITLPNSVKTLGYWAFSACEKLSNVTLSDNLTSIEQGTFCGTAIKKLYIPSSVKTILHDYVSEGNRSPFIWVSSSCQIYCGVPAKPAEWSEYWNCYQPTTNSNNYKLNVHWGVTREQFNALP